FDDRSQEVSIRVGVLLQLIRRLVERRVHGAGRSVVHRMREHHGRRDPFQPMVVERQRAEERRAGSERMNGRADIVEEPRRRQLRRTYAAADCRLGFVNDDLAPQLRDDDGCGQAVRARSDNDGVGLSHEVSTRVALIDDRRSNVAVMTDTLPGYWLSRLVFERALALIYFVAFLVAANQFVPLLGERGLTPVSRFVRYVPFRASPSLFYLAPTDAALRAAAWAGVILSAIAVVGLADRRHALVSAVLWAAMWALYLSFVNVGQTFYGFGWETLLLEAGFLAIFLGSGRTAPIVWLNWAYRWLLFRVMFGAGLIKLRGDPCWRN